MVLKENPAREKKQQTKTKKTSVSTIFRLKERPIINTTYYILLDEKLNFKQDIDTAILKINKGISVIKKLRQFATEIPNDNLQSFFKAPYWLWRYHLWPTLEWNFLCKTRISAV